MAELKRVTPHDEKPSISCVTSKEQEVRVTDGRCSSRRIFIWKNLLVVTIGFLLNFTAFQSLSNLQSSLNKDEGLGVVGLSVIYGALVVSCLFLSSIFIKTIGCKWSVVVCFLPYALYTAANFYAVWATIIPCSVLVGIAAAPLWVAKCAYLTELAIRYAAITGDTVEAIINRFFGIFFMVFQSGQIWGNLVSSFILQTNGTIVAASDEELANCGAAYCPWVPERNLTNLERPSNNKVYTLCGIYLALGLAASLFVALFLDRLSREDGTFIKTKTLSCNVLIATLYHIKNNVSQLLLIPLTIYSGLEQAFITGDYTKTFVSCSLGIWMVGLVMICFGAADAIGSLVFGRLVKYTGRIPLFVGGAVVHLGLHITLLLWRPHPTQLSVFFIIAAFWGLGDAVWQTQVNGTQQNK